MNFDELANRGLSLTALRAFIAVVRAGSVVAAAKGSSSRRSLISRQINGLERTLGFDLFRREGRRLILTKAGRELAVVTSSYFLEVETLTAETLQQQTRLTLWAGASVLESLVFPRLLAVRQRLDNCSIEFGTGSTRQVINALANGTGDIGIVRASSAPRGTISFPCGKIEFLLAVRRDPLRPLTDWSLGQLLENLPLTLIRGSGNFVSEFYTLCSELGVEPRIDYRVDSFGNARDILASGACGAILPKPLAATLSPSAFACLEFAELGRLDRSLSIIVDQRTAKIHDRLQIVAEVLAELFIG